MKRSRPWAFFAVFLVRFHDHKRIYFFKQVAELGSRCEELTVTSESAARSTAVLEASLVADISRMKAALASAQNEKQVVQASFLIELQFPLEPFLLSAFCFLKKFLTGK